MKRTILPVTLLLAACSSNPEPVPAPVPAATTQTVTPAPTPPPASGAFDPVGSYDFTVEFQGQTQSGVITISKQQDGKMAGTMSGPDGSAINLSSVTVDGRKINVIATIPSGPELNMTLNFETNDRFAGTVAVQGMSLPLTGTRKKSS